MREFNIPKQYRSSAIATLKYARQKLDPKKRDLTPSVLDCGEISFKIARHFGFCFGVQNAIEKAYRAVEENQGRRVFLISEMIHNRIVNEDLKSKGVHFLSELSPKIEDALELLKSDDVVIIPAFGATLELLEKLKRRGISSEFYDTTCPFVERVWRKVQTLGKSGFSVVIHGKHKHEEVQATFSHASKYAPSIVIKDQEEARLLAEFITDERPLSEFEATFSGVVSEGFDASSDLDKIGVVNQTTMLAEETHAICEIIKNALLRRFDTTEIGDRFAETEDTLCYATTENQESVKALLSDGGDLALVVGGYNSSNTSHLVELLQWKIPTYYIESATEILNRDQIQHYVLSAKDVKVSSNWLPQKRKPVILLTAGASCPDVAVDDVLTRVAECLELNIDFDAVVNTYIKGLQ
ncbi:MAG: 4-hydroxy-3-methylbut-2-enyl diphosphate reductase [Bdellovibrionota bacterium]|jgi:4-hydroxy-3-methylbut-2-enyl diphosphate reductase